MGMKANEFVKKLGVEVAKKVLSGSPSNAQSYQDGYYFRTSPEFLFHNGFHHWEMTTNNGKWFKDKGFSPILIDDLKRLVESHDLVESLGGLEKAKELLVEVANRDHRYAQYFEKPALEKAIADVEACQ